MVEVSAFLAPTGRAKDDLSSESTSDADQGNRGDPFAVLASRAVHDLYAFCRYFPPTMQGRTWGQSQRLEGEQPAEHRVRFNPYIADAVVAAEYEWKKSGNIPSSTCMPTQDATVTMAG